ncbi:hypothetical protein TOPH_04409 [Tolypocladium ophioglossoides CBS 100239]|uniref:Extracellular serine-rich protein n=1 Tax=Tolypocladium ophioglossoides (strain CBS 100239) TaxID=1163406 RepID=A0A0L0NA93_TOLOC|nr:hypothetical protein TOPH_04409 [Tolypocladium ophioglossoides CBS 100239]
MQLTSTLLGLAAIAATSVSAQKGSTIKVTVADGGLKYDPPSLTAQVGTAIQFNFFPKNHTVTQSSFGDPCHPLEGGFFSGFVPVKDSPSGTSFTITVTDTKPIWFYCGQGSHCQSGMVGAINAPTSGNTFEAFAALAKKATNSTSPPGGAVGGVLSNSNSTSSSSPSSSSVAQSSSAYTTKPYTSTWTTNGSTFTSTATSTLFTAGPAPTTTSSAGPSGSTAAASSAAASTGAAATALPRFNALNAGALIVAAAAML